MQCKSVLTRIDALRTGELDSHESSDVSQHLQTCRSCDESVEDIAQFAGAIRNLTEEPPKPLSQNVCRAVCDEFDVIELEGETMYVAFGSKGIRMLTLSAANQAEFRDRYRARYRRDLKRGSLSENARAQIIAAFKGTASSMPEIDLSDLTEFERKVLETIVGIPRGEVRPYAWVARKVDRPDAIRAVGNVMARNPVPLLLPCHRVVPTGGGVGNYAFGSPRKREFLEREGVAVDELDSLAKDHVRYIGSATTKIFCFPTCSDARRIRSNNRVALRDEQTAKRLGFRPCKRCHPVAIGA